MKRPSNCWRFRRGRRRTQPSVNIGSAPEDDEDESRLLLRFAAPRDPVMVADWVSFNVIDTEKQDWARGWAALKRFTEREGHARVPYGHKEDAYPLGQWVAEQRRAFGAGQMSGLRARRLEKLGMVWSLADERFQENLAAAKAYHEQYWTLCAPRPATMLDRRVGQWLSNLRRPGALEGHPDWETALEEVDEDWNPSRPPEWQRHYAALRELVRDEEGPAEVLPGFTIHGMDIGRWLLKQGNRKSGRPWRRGNANAWRPSASSPCPRSRKRPPRPPRGPLARSSGVWRQLAQYKDRTGSVTVLRAHVEQLPDGTQVKLGVFLSNTKSRRGKLTADKLQQLADLGLEWAAA